MTHLAEPGQGISTHDLILISGATEVPLILCDRQGNRNNLAWDRTPLQTSSLKMYSGEQTYADLTPPWTPVAQTDWSGGRGSKDFDKDQTMYYDGYNINTIRPGEVILGPKATEINLTTACTNTIFAGTINNLLNTATPAAATYYEAYKFTASTSVTAASVTVSIMATYPVTDTGSLQVGLATVNTGVPDATTLAANMSTTTLALSDISSSLTTYNFTLAATLALTATTDYFLVFKFTSLDTTPSSTYRLVYQASTTALSADERKISSNGSDWTSASIAGVYEPYFIIYGADANCKRHYFEYKGALFGVGQNDDASASHLYLLGDQGMCETTGTATAAGVTTVKTHSGYKHWAEHEAKGGVFILVSGTGSDQPQPWRIITDNAAHGNNSDTPDTATGSFEFAQPFDKLPDDTTQFAIVAKDVFTEIKDVDGNTFASDFASGRVTDVLVCNGSAYLALGDGTAMVALRANDETGVWTYTFSGTSTGVAAETGAFTYLAYGIDKDYAPVIWGAKSGYPSTIAKAPAQDNTAFTGADEAVLTFGSAISVGDLNERITNLEIYTSPYNGMDTLNIHKEHSVHYLYNDLPIEYSIREFRNTADSRNGKASTVHGVYMYFSWHGTILRYYNGMLDRVGPDKAEVGFPTAEEVGDCVALTGYPGIVLAGYDAGTRATGVSSVLAYNQQGWCELYRSTAGRRIQNIYVQSIPGNTVDRLWISVGASLVWIPLSIDPYNHPISTYGSYVYETTGYLISPWYYLGVQGVNKMFNSLRLVIENCLADYEEIKAEYQIDDETGWTEIYGDMDTYVFDSFSEEIDLATTPSKSGKRIRFKLTLISHDGAETPRLVAQVLEAVTRIPTKYVTTLTARLVDDDTQRDSAPDAVRLAATKWANLLTFQAQATPVLTECGFAMLDNMYAFVDDVTPIPLALNDAEGKRDKYIVQIRLIEV